MLDNENGDIIIYQTDDGLTKIEELDKKSTCQKFRQVRKEGNRNVLKIFRLNQF